MPARGRGSKPSRDRALIEDDLVQTLVPDPSVAAEASVVLAGFLGRAPVEGKWRLYASADLSAWVELSEDDILHSQPLPADDGPLGGTVVWVRSAANLSVTRVVSRAIQAEFLTGDISRGMERAAAGADGELRQPVSLTSRLGQTWTDPGRNWTSATCYSYLCAGPTPVSGGCTNTVG